MKRHGARWSRAGAGNLARLLAAQANAELMLYQAHPAVAVPVRITGLAAAARTLPALKHMGEDPARWLTATLPALSGPHADRPWVKWCLRQLSRIPALA